MILFNKLKIYLFLVNLINNIKIILKIIIILKLKL